MCLCAIMRMMAVEYSFSLYVLAAIDIVLLSLFDYCQGQCVTHCSFRGSKCLTPPHGLHLNKHVSNVRTFLLLLSGLAYLGLVPSGQI